MALAISFDSPNFMVLRWTFAFWNSHVSFFYQAFSTLPEGNTRYRSGYCQPGRDPKNKFPLIFVIS